MATKISVGIEGAETFKKILYDLDNKLPQKSSVKMRKTTNKIISDLKRNMDSMFTAPRGNLKQRTRLKKTGFLEYNIVMPKYGEFVNTGTKPHRVKNRPYLFRPWERKTGIASLQTVIIKKGTYPRPFIDETIQKNVPKRMKEFSSEILAELKKIAKGGI